MISRAGSRHNAETRTRVRFRFVQGYREGGERVICAWTGTQQFPGELKQENLVGMEDDVCMVRCKVPVLMARGVRLSVP